MSKLSLKRLGRRISYVCRALCNVIVILLHPRFLIFVCLLLKKRKIELWLRATLLGKFNSELVDFLSFIDQFTELNYSSDYQDIFILYQVK